VKGIARLWFTGAWWVLPAGVLGGVLYALTAVSPQPHAQPIAAAADASESGLLVFGFAAAACAITAARLRDAGLFRRPVARSRLVVALECLAPVFVATALAVVVAVLWVQLPNRAMGWPGWGVVGVDASILLAACLWGYALGRWLTAWVAAPLALVGTYVVLGFPASFNPLWIRHLFGIIGCCAIDESLSLRVVAASMLTAVGSDTIAVAAILAAPTAPLGPRVRWSLPSAKAVTRLLVATVASLACVSLAVSLAQPLGLKPTTMREGHLICADVGEGQRMCVWPEHVGAFEEYKPVLRAVRRVEQAHGLTPTRLFTERMVRDPRAAYLDAAPGETSPRRLYAVSGAMSPDGDRCVTTPEGQGLVEASGIDSESALALRAWWSHALANELKVPVELDPMDPLIAGLPPSRQDAWVDAPEGCQPSGGGQRCW
jgi:hypothetical protein